MNKRRHLALLPTHMISTAEAAITTTPETNVGGADYLVVQTKFLYGAGGTTVDAYVQTTLDGGVSWIDVMNFHFTTSAATKISAVNAITALAAGITPGDGALASNTILSGLLGSQFRVKYTTVGTYSGATSLTIDAYLADF